MAADGLALTFWKAQSCLADEFRGVDGESVAPPPRLRAARTAAMAAADEGWNVDAGLALSRPAFRAAVREIVGKQGFDEHCAAPTFTAWEAFAGSDPFTAEPSVQFYVPTTSLAADHAPCVCVAAFLAALDFVPRGC